MHFSSTIPKEKIGQYLKIPNFGKSIALSKSTLNKVMRARDDQLGHIM